MAVGSGQQTVQALGAVLSDRGGEYRVGQTVRRILVERADGNGAWRAVGVELADGTSLRARAVASSSGLEQTLLDMVGAEALGPEATEAIQNNFQLDEYALFVVHLALARAPSYARADAQGTSTPADQALRVLVGVETPEEIAALWQEIRAGTLPEPRGMVVTVPTLFDPSQAPPDHHTAVLLQPVPYAPDGAPERWAALRDDYAARCVAAWRRYARNLADEDVLATFALTPEDVATSFPHLVRGALGMGRMTARQAGANRPLPPLSHYATPVQGSVPL